MSPDGPREADQLGEPYLSRLGHDLRASLNNIIGWAELLRSGTLDEQGTIRAAETIARQVEQQGWLVTDLLDTWSLLAGTFVLGRERVDVTEIVGRALELVGPMAATRRIALDGPQGADRNRVAGDARRLQHALVMVLCRAIRALPEGGALEVRLGQSASSVVISICSRGASRAWAGDVELHLARRIVELHGGTIRQAGGEPGALDLAVSLPLGSPVRGRGT